MTLTAATRAETTKQFSTSLWWLLSVVLVAYVGATAAGIGFVFAAAAAGMLPDSPHSLPAATLPPLLYSTATAIGYVFPLLLGTLMVTSEFRHQTLTPTFLATPRRGRVLAAKLAVGAVMGALLGLLGIASSVIPSAAVLAAYGHETDLTSLDTWLQVGRMLLAYVLWALVGVGLGALVRNQVGAIVGILVFTQFLEPIARMAGAFVEALADITRFLPGAAGDALVGASLYTAMTVGASAGDELAWWTGGLVLLGYAVALVLLGHLVSRRRDVT